MRKEPKREAALAIRIEGKTATHTHVEVEEPGAFAARYVPASTDPIHCRHEAQTTTLRKSQSSLLVEDARVCALLRRIISKLTVDQALRDDMMQECQIHLWRLESNEPGHTRSWYLQSCRFHLQHWLASGRSVDSLKRANGDRRVEINGVSETLHVEWHHTNDELIEVVSARDIVSTLAAHLKPCECGVLRGLADGMPVRDIAKNLELSYPTARKCRRRIAALAARLGISPPAPSSRVPALSLSRGEVGRFKSE